MSLAVIQSLAGRVEKDQPVKETGLLKFPTNPKYSPVNQTRPRIADGCTCAVPGSNLPAIEEGVSETLNPASDSLLPEYSRIVEEDSVVVKETSNSEKIVSGSSVVKTTSKTEQGHSGIFRDI